MRHAAPRMVLIVIVGLAFRAPAARAQTAPAAVEAEKPANPPAETAPAPAAPAPAPPNAATPPAETPPAPPAPAPPPAPVAPVKQVRDTEHDNWPLVTLDVNNPLAVLQAATPPKPASPEQEAAPPLNRDWTEVCDLPCERRQDPQKLYRIGGRSVVASSTFRLPESNRRVTIKGRVGKKGQMIGGMIVGLIGLGNLALNGLAYASADSSSNGYSSSNNSSNKDIFAVGMVIGGLAGIIGLLIAGGAATSVHVE